MKIVIVSDAWFPQVNGVVRTLSTVADRVRRLGHEVEVIGPDRFRSIPCPTYPEIRLACWRVGRTVREIIHDFGAQVIHIATEGPLGLAARGHARRRGVPFTTSFHTFFPDYLALRFGLPRSWSFAYLRRFHGRAAATMVSTETMERILAGRGFVNLARWRRAVDTELFAPHKRTGLDFPRPIMMYVGRVAVEKNIEAFLAIDRPGTKVIVGDGPQRREMESRYPDVRFLGTRYGEELAGIYASADVFVLPSRTETFGLVLLEAMASGVPVAAYPVQGPMDIVTDPAAGALDEDLGRAIDRALGLSREACRAHALTYSWDTSAREFVGHLHPFA
ncbi:MAG: glycosyltransferase family 1 protein [Rhodospirillaceae bacterium]|nr:glycosyltransferase family 1 protein [Rhodospirillaceae bacterium]